MPWVDDVLDGLQVQIDKLWYDLLRLLALAGWTLQKGLFMMGHAIELANIWLVENAFGQLGLIRKTLILPAAARIRTRVSPFFFGTNKVKSPMKNKSARCSLKTFLKISRSTLKVKVSSPIRLSTIPLTTAPCYLKMRTRQTTSPIPNCSSISIPNKPLSKISAGYWPSAH